MSKFNIIGVYHLATTAEVTEGLEWYPRANTIVRMIADNYEGLSRAQVAGVIAALSPRNRWERNVADAENLLRVFSIDPDSVDSVKVCTFTSNKNKAVKILTEAVTEADILNILSGPKLQEFYNCIAGLDDVCIDGHAYSIWAGDRITLDSIPSIGKKLRQQIKSDYREAAATLNLKPSELQAITWCAWRRLHNV